MRGRTGHIAYNKNCGYSRIGRHVGLKIQRILHPCGFDSRCLAEHLVWLDGEEFAIVNIKIHYNIVNNFGIYDRIESTIEEFKLFNLHGYCKV